MTGNRQLATHQSMITPLRRFLALTTLFGLLPAVLPSHAVADAQPPADAAQIAAARAASKELGETLKAQLMTAIKSGGVPSAISVCKTIAPNIATDISTKSGLSVRRTALRVRNPANAPDAFETRVLEEFLTKLAAGADPMTLEHAETVTDNGTTKLRYMKAIPTAAEPCLACHGSDLKPEVKAEIAKLYPGDKATNFKAGELRGAFSITQTVK